MSTLQFDEATSRRVEATYTTPDVVEQRRITLRTLDLRPGEDVLDIGSGPGFLACEMAQRVGTTARCTASIPARACWRCARPATPAGAAAARAFRRGETRCPAVPGRLVRRRDLDPGYEYVEDMPAALAEARRVLRPAAGC